MISNQKGLPEVYLAIDPGREKFGWALFVHGQLMDKGIGGNSEFKERVGGISPKPSLVVLGNGTGHQPYLKTLESMGLETVTIDEKSSTEEGVSCYFREETPDSFFWVFRRLFNLPGRAVDDWAAVVIGRRFLQQKG